MCEQNEDKDACERIASATEILLKAAPVFKSGKFDNEDIELHGPLKDTTSFDKPPPRGNEPLDLTERDEMYSKLLSACYNLQEVSNRLTFFAGSFPYHNNGFYDHQERDLQGMTVMAETVHNLLQEVLKYVKVNQIEVEKEI